MHFQGSSFLLVGPSLHNNLHLMRFTFIYRRGVGVVRKPRKLQSPSELKKFHLYNCFRKENRNMLLTSPLSVSEEISIKRFNRRNRVARESCPIQLFMSIVFRSSSTLRPCPASCSKQFQFEYNFGLSTYSTTAAVSPLVGRSDSIIMYLNACDLVSSTYLSIHL